MSDLIDLTIGAIETQFVDSETRVFWPNSDCIKSITEDKVEQVVLLNRLVAAGVLEREWRVYCPEGHELWTGRDGELSEARKVEGHWADISRHSILCEDCLNDPYYNWTEVDVEVSCWTLHPAHEAKISARYKVCPTCPRPGKSEVGGE